MIRPDIQKLIDRGNVTPAEVAELRCNSWEWEALIPKMNDEAFVRFVEHALNNTGVNQIRRPFATYDDSVKGLLAPELLRRFRSLAPLNKALSDLREGPSVRKSVRSLVVRARVAAGAAWASERKDDEEVRRILRECALAIEALAIDVNDLARALDGVREALGQKETHFLVIADDVKELVMAIENCEADGGCRAATTLGKIRAEPGSGAPKVGVVKEIWVRRIFPDWKIVSTHDTETEALEQGGGGYRIEGPYRYVEIGGDK